MTEAQLDEKIIAEILTAIRPGAEAYQGFQEIDDYVVSLMDEFLGLCQGLAKTAKLGDGRQHGELALEACRQTRRIRLRLGSPRRLAEETRQKLIDLFRQAVGSIQPDLCPEAQLRADADRARQNITTRIRRLEFPEELEQELLCASHAPSP
jgi:hypothetical protein